MTTTINGKPVTLPPERSDDSFLVFLREDLDLTGTKNGCNEGACGSCTVLIDNKAKKACRLKLGDVADREVLTIEGMTGSDGTIHPLQQAFVDSGAIQCGFCTPGMVLTAHAFLRTHQKPKRGDIRRAISSNLCRCTGYQQIIDAIERAASHY